jgi:hypothetical protein
LYFCDRPLIQKLMPSHLLTSIQIGRILKIVSNAYTKSPPEKHAFTIYPDDLALISKKQNPQNP